MASLPQTTLGVPVGPESAHASPWKLGGLSPRQLAVRVWEEFNEDEVLDRGAALSYYFIFALFPTLLLMTTLFGMLPGPDLIGRMMGYLDQVLPGDTASVIKKTMAEIVQGAHGGLLSLGALGALWGASSGVASMMSALNVTYDVEDTRPWWKRRLIAVGLTLALSLLVVTAMVLLVFGGTIGQMLGNRIGLGQIAVLAWNVLQWPVAVGCVITGVALVYFLGPAVEQRWYWVTPGSVFATASWIALSLGLRYYVAHFANYNRTYGSIGGVILLLLWLYVAGVVLLVGAEINSEIEVAAAERGASSAKARGEHVSPADALRKAS